MSRISHPLQKQRMLGSNTRRYKTTLALIFSGFVIGLLLAVKSNNNKNNSSVSMMGVTKVSKKIQEGTLEYSVYGDVRSVAYYHCASLMPADKSKHLVLLHGAKFTKEDWKTSGILDNLCGYPNLSVSAMDLPVKAGHKDLMGMLLSMKEDGSSPLHISLPVTSLVTPSASGMTITDWMATGRLPDLPQYVKQWIPIASFAVTAGSTEDQLTRMSRLNDFEVLAIHGSKDKGGKESTGRLEKFVGAKFVELKGGHSCYLDSPTEFCNVMVKAMGI
eukprot:scaffold825_cov147-Cylindrotheca_fusiformis.AAC.3